MQVFLPYKDTFKTAIVLDNRRLNKQIIEINQILNAIYGHSNGWKNHPVTKMYSNNTLFLEYFIEVLKNIKDKKNDIAKEYSKLANNNLPVFITQEYCDNFKKRLYTKDSIFYAFFQIYGKSYENWYFVNNEWKIYKQIK